MPASLFLWVFLTAICAAILLARRVPLSVVGKTLGLRPGRWHWYLASFGVAALSIGVAVLVLWLGHFSLSPTDDDGYLTASHYAGWSLGFVTLLQAFGRELLYTALGEELFFRGFVAGQLFRHLSFQRANALQTLVFMLPHLALLAVLGLNFWPLLIPVVVAGWLLGWLRYNSGSIFPGVLAHGLVNTAAAAFAMLSG